jgi:hypothetical protein
VREFGSQLRQFGFQRRLARIGKWVFFQAVVDSSWSVTRRTGTGLPRSVLAFS